MCRRLLPVLFASLGLASPASAEVSYTRDIRPFLAKYCLECHTSDKPRGGVALDSYAVMVRGNDPVFHPGHPDKSDLIKVLGASSGRKLMPPRKFALRPTPEEVAVVRAWVAAGARDDSPAPGRPTPESKPEKPGDPTPGGARRDDD